LEHTKKLEAIGHRGGQEEAAPRIRGPQSTLGAVEKTEKRGETTAHRGRVGLRNRGGGGEEGGSGGGENGGEKKYKTEKEKRKKILIDVILKKKREGKRENI